MRTGYERGGLPPTAEELLKGLKLGPLVEIGARGALDRVARGTVDWRAVATIILRTSPAEGVALRDALDTLISEEWTGNPADIGGNA